MKPEDSVKSVLAFVNETTYIINSSYTGTFISHTEGELYL